MKLLDILLCLIASIMIVLILLLIKSFSSPELLNLLISMKVVENSTAGIKNIFIFILVASAITFSIILSLFIRLLLRIFKKKDHDYKI